MKHIKLFKAQLATFARRELLLIEGQPEPEVTNYEMWRNYFTQKRLRLGIWVGLLYFLSFLPLDIAGYLSAHPFAGLWLLTNIARIASLLICSLLLRNQLFHRRLGFIFLSVSWSISLSQQLSDTLKGSGEPQIFTWTMLFISQATLVPVYWPLHFVSQLGALVYYFGVNRLLGLNLAYSQMPAPNLLLNLFWICCICNLSVYLYERLARAEFHARQKLKAAQEQSERLLLNILPISIAERLKQEQSTIADSFAEATVLFADIVGFTPLAERIPPTEVVALLNQIFSKFDRLADRHGLEKIKTIGDAYMAVAGLPEPCSNHAKAVADMALEMQQALTLFNQQTGYDLSIRIGIHTGPVVAGVIGLKKFSYDLWGDTVNTASRMESHGIPGYIHLTEATYFHLKEQYLFEGRGLIPIKGKGHMKTYLLKGKRTTLPGA